MFHSRERPVKRDLIRGVLLLGVTMLVLHAASAQSNTQLPTRGTRFWTGFMQNGFGAQTLKVHIVSASATSGTVSMPLTGWSTSFNVAANGATVVDVPASAENTGSGTIQNKGLLIQSQDSVNVFIVSFQNYTHELSQVLPESSLGISYRVDAYQGLPNFNNLHKSELLVLATQDGTQVRITPSVNIAGGGLAGVPLTVDLNAGQCYQVQAAQDVLDLTGTLVEATDASGPCRPFMVIGGSMCATAPGSCSACDHVFEQSLPVTSWGTRYFTVPVNGTTNVTYRVLAHQNGTQVSIAGAPPIVLNAGQRHEVNASTVPVCIEADKPISVAELLEGFSCAGNGDPSLFLISPTDRASTDARFITPTSGQINTHSISIVVPSAATSQVLVDGAPLSSALFQPYASCADRKYAKVPVAAGPHRLQCSAGFQAYMFGLGYGESYASAVHDVQATVVQEDSIICGAGQVTLTSLEPLANAQWTAASAPNVVIGTGNSITLTLTQSESYTVSGALPVSGCPRQFTYNVGIPLTIPTLLTANDEPAITVCQYEPVQLGLTPPPDPAWFDIHWSPEGSLDDPTSSSPIATPLHTMWYVVDVTSPTGCGDMTDSILVTVQPGAIIDLNVSAQPSTLCMGNSTQLGSSILRALARDGFDAPPNAMWTAVQGGTISTACGSTDGSALYFNGNGQRYAQTLAYNTIGGGFVRFRLKIADGSSPCDDAEPGDDVVLEYSVNNGLNWNTIATFLEGDYPSFTSIDVPIPTAAQNANAMFRVRQVANSGSGHDNWALDEFLLARYDNAFAAYSWDPAATLNNGGVSAPIATPSASGWYVLSATDPTAGCVYVDSVQVTVDPAFSIDVTDDLTLCSIAGTPLQATPSSGNDIAYTWSPNDGSLSAIDVPDPTATPSQTTTYSVHALNSSGCSADASVTLTVGQLFGLNVTATTTTVCQGQSSQLNAAVSGGSGLTYAWSGAGLNDNTIAGPIATPTTTTTYTCTVTHAASGCSLSQSITITVNTGYTANAGSDLTLCSTLGHQLTVQHNIPNATYTWSPGASLNAANIQSPTIMTDATATYAVTVSDAFGCSVSDQVTITRAYAGVPVSQNASACENAPPTLTAPATGVSYHWSTGALTASIVPSASGPHTVTMTDAQGCQAISTFHVTLHALPNVDLGADLAICGNAPQTLNAGNAGSSFIWSTGAQTQTISVGTSNTYSVMVTNANNCSASDAVDVQFNAMPTDALNDVSACISSPPTLNAGNPGSTYLWSTGAITQSITPGSSNTYSVTVTTAQDCSATFDAVVTLAPTLSVALGNDTTVCQGQLVHLNAGNPGASHQWSTNATSQSIDASTSGTYSVTVSNGFCSASDAINVTFVPGPVDVLTNVSRCVGEAVTLDAGNPGCSYLWSTNATGPSITVNTSATYSVTVTNATGCSGTFDAVVQFVAPPNVDLGPDTVLCEGRVLTLDAGNPGSTYHWNTGANARTIAVAQPGTYTVTVNNGLCARSDQIIVHFNPSPARMAVHEFHTCLEDEPHNVEIDAGNAGARFVWSTGETDQVILAGAYGWYYVDVTNMYDCSTPDSARVIEYCPATIFVPNTFTPNGDGINDIFLPLGKSIATFHFMVFDRWGEMLFESEDLEQGWDGTYQGALVKDDQYVWRLEYRFFIDKDGTLGFPQNQMGNVQVLR